MILSSVYNTRKCLFQENTVIWTQVCKDCLCKQILRDVIVEKQMLIKSQIICNIHENKENSTRLKKICGCELQTLARPCAPVTDEVHFCKYLLNHFQSYNFYIFKEKLVFFPFFSCILHMI